MMEEEPRHAMKRATDQKVTVGPTVIFERHQWTQQKADLFGDDAAAELRQKQVCTLEPPGSKVGPINLERGLLCRGQGRRKGITVAFHRFVVLEPKHTVLVRYNLNVKETYNNW